MYIFVTSILDYIWDLTEQKAHNSVVNHVLLNQIPWKGLIDA